MDTEKELKFMQLSAALMQMAFQRRFPKSTLDVLAALHERTYSQQRYFTTLYLTDLCEETGHSKPTVSRAVNQLRDLGVVLRFKTGGTGKHGKGKPPLTYKIDGVAVHRLLQGEAA